MPETDRRRIDKPEDLFEIIVIAVAAICIVGLIALGLWDVYRSLP